jgi:cell division septation protein DedD
MMRAASILLLLFSGALPAQTDTVVRPPDDSVVLRAKQLAEDGRPADGRRLIDSVLKVTPPETERYAEVLYWRAALAPTASDAERDYRRLLIESPLSARAEDALLQLAQLEQARGDRHGATDHLQRFMLSYGRSPARPRVAIWMVRLLFEQGPQQTARACEALRAGRDEVPADNAELRNQLEFYAPRCATAETAGPSPQTDSQPAPRLTPAEPLPTPARDTARRETPATRPNTSRPVARPVAAAFYSVQVAAYDTLAQATRLARRLVSRGIEARVDGKAKPFRVRVGKFTTRAAAVKAAVTLKKQGYAGFVTLVRAGQG